MKSGPIRITHNGTRYRSLAALARSLGLSRPTVHKAWHNGRMATLGQGPSRAGQRKRAQPVAAHGFYWPSQKDAAAALGVSTSAVCGALGRGTFDRMVARRMEVQG